LFPGIVEAFLNTWGSVATHPPAANLQRKNICCEMQNVFFLRYFVQNGAFACFCGILICKLIKSAPNFRAISTLLHVCSSAMKKGEPSQEPKAAQQKRFWKSTALALNVGKFFLQKSAQICKFYARISFVLTFWSWWSRFAVDIVKSHKSCNCNDTCMACQSASRPTFLRDAHRAGLWAHS